MKKLISALIAIAMIMSIGLPALATDPTPVTTPAPTDNGHTQVIADADPDYMIVIPRTVNFGELAFRLSSDEMGSVEPGDTSCTFTIEDVENDDDLTAVKDGTVSCTPADLRAAGSYRGWMTYAITYEYDGTTTDLEIPGDHVTIDFTEIDPPVTPTVAPTVEP